MRQAVLGLGLFLLLGTVAGCGYTDPAVQVADGIIGQMRESSTEMRKVTEELDKVVGEAKKNNKKFTKADLKPAVKAMEGLRQVGTKLVELNADAERIGAKVTTEKSQELLNQYKGRAQSEFEALDAAYSALNKSADQVRALIDTSDTTGAETLEFFNDELRTAMQDFVSLTRPK